MFQFKAHPYVALAHLAGALAQCASNQEKLISSLPLLITRRQKQVWRETQALAITDLRERLAAMRGQLLALELKSSIAQVDRILSMPAESPQLVWQAVEDLILRIHDELETEVLFRIEEREYFEQPFANWGDAPQRFRVQADVEEASKCYAFGRYSSAVFHLMRAAEGAVIALGALIDPDDHKPQFGSVLKKLDHLLNKVRWQDWPSNAKPHKALFENVLPLLYAVKKSWRDKEDHFDGRIVPRELEQSRERAREIYNATSALLRTLAEDLDCGERGERRPGQSVIPE